MRKLTLASFMREGKLGIDETSLIQRYCTCIRHGDFLSAARSRPVDSGGKCCGDRSRRDCIGDCVTHNFRTTNGMINKCIVARIKRNGRP